MLVTGCPGEDIGGLGDAIVPAGVVVFCFVVVVVVVVVVVWCCCFCCVAVVFAAAEDSVGTARLSGQIFVWYRLRWMRIAWFAGVGSRRGAAAVWNCMRDVSPVHVLLLDDISHGGHWVTRFSGTFTQRDRGSMELPTGRITLIGKCCGIGSGRCGQLGSPGYVHALW